MIFRTCTGGALTPGSWVSGPVTLTAECHSSSQLACWLLRCNARSRYDIGKSSPKELPICHYTAGKCINHTLCLAALSDEGNWVWVVRLSKVI